jgi:mRNA interferase MazF
MKVRRGEVVLVDYPYSDGTGSKVRPALVVQSDNLKLRITDTILAAISRSQHRASATQILVTQDTGQASYLFPESWSNMIRNWQRLRLFVVLILAASSSNPAMCD